MWNLKKGTNELINKTEIVTDVENKLMVTRGGGEGVGQIGRLGLTYTHYYI